MSEVYLMHLFAPVCPTHPARHYLGFTSATAAKRAEQYRNLVYSYHGRLMLAAVERGIGFKVARVWKGASKLDEKLLRDLHNNPRLCPDCNPSLNLVTRLNAAGNFQTYRVGDVSKPRYGDLALVRQRTVRATRARIRNDGTSNMPDRLVVDYTPIDSDYAAYGFND